MRDEQRGMKTQCLQGMARGLEGWAMGNLGPYWWETGLGGEADRSERSSSVRPWSKTFTSLETLVRPLGNSIWHHSGGNNEGRGTGGRETKEEATPQFRGREGDGASGGKA